MNFGAPAQCNGTVTSWRYCSYNRYMEDNEDCDGRENYMAKFLVYRQIGNSTYEPVPGSTKSVTLSLRCPSDGGFQCGRLESLTPTEQFNIQVNDIVAACLLDQDPIRLVSNELRGSSRQVYRYSGEDCTSSQLATVDTQNSAFTLDTGIAFFVIRYYSRLHLYAETSSSESILMIQCIIY